MEVRLHSIALLNPIMGGSRAVVFGYFWKLNFIYSNNFWNWTEFCIHSMYNHNTYFDCAKMSSFCFPNLLYFSNTMKNQISQLFLPREVKVHQWSKVKAAQSCLNPCDSIDYTVRGILQARILERVAVHFSRESFQPRDWTHVSCIAGRFFTSKATREAQEYWSG